MNNETLGDICLKVTKEKKDVEIMSKTCKKSRIYFEISPQGDDRIRGNEGVD